MAPFTLEKNNQLQLRKTSRKQKECPLAFRPKEKEREKEKEKEKEWRKKIKKRKKGKKEYRSLSTEV